MACEWRLNSSLSRRSLPVPGDSLHNNWNSSSSVCSGTADYSSIASGYSSRSRSTLPRCHSEDVLYAAGCTPGCSLSSSPRSSACSSPSRRSIASDGPLYIQGPWLYHDYTYSHHRPTTPSGTSPVAAPLSRLSSGSLSGAQMRRVCSLSECSRTLPPASRREVQPSSIRRIFKAKQVLADLARISTSGPELPPECVRSYTAERADSAAFGLLIRLLSSSTDQQQTLDYLDTVSVLAADDASRQLLLKQGAERAVLDLLGGGSSSAVQCSALDALVCICKARKAAFWKGPGKLVLLSLLKQQTKPRVLLAAVQAVSAFTLASSSSSSGGGGGSQQQLQQQPCEVLEPAVVGAVARLLGPSIDSSVCLAALALLQRVAAAPGAHLLPGWRCCIFQVVSLLCPSAQLSAEAAHEALQLLLVLADAPVLHSAICSAVCFGPLLALLQHRDRRLALGAACLLGSLADTACGQSALAEDGALSALLRALQGRQAVDVKIGALYALRCLAQSRPHALQQLRARGAVPLLLRLLPELHDEDAMLGVLHLLALLGYQEHQHRRQQGANAAGSTGADVSSGSNCAAVLAKAGLEAPAARVSVGH